MFISKVNLINYRNFRNSKFIFNEGINTVIGENGSGKTNLFRAIRLVLDDSLLQYSYKLSENDFNRSIGSWHGHWIIISLEFDNINTEEAIQALFVHGTGAIVENTVDRATYNLFFRPKADIRFRLSELEPGDKDGLQKILEKLTIKDNYETIFTGKSVADFSDENVYKSLVGDFENVLFPSSIDASIFGAKIPHQLSISKEISFTFIQALRDVVSDFHNNRTNPLLLLLKHKSGEINEVDYHPISEVVEQLNNMIEGLDDVQNIRKDITTTIQAAVGKTYSPSSLSIKSSLPSEADKLLQSLKLFIGEPGEDYEGGISELSLGGANLIFLTLKLLQFKYQQSKQTFANFLIIEEPEAHIHNHIQKTLFDKLNYSDTQIIYSTHSTQISEVSNVNNINILAKKLNYACCYQPANGLDVESINQIQRYLDAVRTNLLFAKGVVLVEGDAEEILIPQLLKKAFGVSLDELGISLINIRSTGFSNVAQLFDDARIQRKCSIVTDLDAAIGDTTIYEDDDEKVKKYKNKMIASQSAGLQRKEALSEFVGDNKWCCAFYADNTFEVDFIKSGNSAVVVAVLPDVYSDDTVIDQSRIELESGDMALFGKRVLTMAQQEGKGWFSILLGSQVTWTTIVPRYILDAIVFSKESFSKTTIAEMLQYRIQKNAEIDASLDLPLCQALIDRYKTGEISTSALIIDFPRVLADRQIIQFLKSIELNEILG